MGTRVHPVLTTVARINSPDFETEERYNNWIELLLYIESVSSREWIVLFLLSKRPSPPCSLLRALIQRCKNTRVYVINLSQLHTPPLFATNRGNCGAIWIALVLLTDPPSPSCFSTTTRIHRLSFARLNKLIRVRSRVEAKIGRFRSAWSFEDFQFLPSWDWIVHYKGRRIWKWRYICVYQVEENF